MYVWFRSFLLPTKPGPPLRTPSHSLSLSLSLCISLSWTVNCVSSFIQTPSNKCISRVKGARKMERDGGCLCEDWRTGNSLDKTSLSECTERVLFFSLSIFPPCISGFRFAECFLLAAVRSVVKDIPGWIRG